MQSKQQRLYYQQNNREAVRQELMELSRQIKEMEDQRPVRSTSDPHRFYYYN
jgi:phage-related minor tail protein